MKLLITGITGMHNRGVEAFVVPTIEQLRQRNPEIEITLLTPTPDYDKIRLQNYNVNLELESKHLQALSQSPKKRLVAKLLPFYKLPSTSHLIGNATAVIASGGDVFSPEYDISPHLKPLKLALEAGVPIIFLAQSISPYKTDEQAESWLEVARYSKLITVREKLTYKYLTQDLGLSPELVKLTADPAFLLPASPAEQVNNMLKSYGITGDRPIVAISTSQGICGYASGLDYTQHLKAWKKVVMMILDELDAEVLIIPHVQKPVPKSDDRILATILLRELNYNPRVHIAGADHTASEFKGLISACDLVIAERTHAAIAGLCSGVCTVAVGYSVKAEGIMADLVGIDLLNQGLLIPIENFVNPELACETIRDCWEKRQQVSLRIQNELPKVKDKASNNFDLLLEAIH
ncbi:MAG: polysaccharide pyruvyl transferase family protein [Nostoc sp. LLA-1]|nr:polysaccharide pyruvyl transferase family protein [Cyanocohniella sp. LLY]